MTSGIYQITNRTNGKRYIGSAVNIRKRWQEHLSTLRRGRHYNRHLQRAFTRYGETAFLFDVLESAEPEVLIVREQHYLDTLKPEYNIAFTADSQLGYQRSLEARKKMSEKKRARRLSEKHRRKISEALIGRQVSDETRRKLSEASSGWHQSHESRRKMREAWTLERRQGQSKTRSGEGNPNYGKPRTEETRLKTSQSLKTYWHKVHAMENQ